MSKKRKAPKSPETIVTPEGTWHQPPLTLGAAILNSVYEDIDTHHGWEAVYQAWLDRLADCGYPAWPNSTAFYLGCLDMLFDQVSNHHK